MIGWTLLAALQVGAAAADVNQSPIFLNPAPLIEGDYPKMSLMQGQYGIVSLVLQISAYGKVVSCKISETSGFPLLDKQSCKIVMKRARFEPGKDNTGSPVAAEYRMSINWVLNQHRPLTRIDAQLYVSQIDADYHKPVDARLIFDANGHVQSCEIRTSSGSLKSDQAVCLYAKAKLVMSPPKSGAPDIPAAAVRYLNASLSLQPAETPTVK